jgi:hypothetical protein
MCAARPVAAGARVVQEGPADTEQLKRFGRRVEGIGCCFPACNGQRRAEFTADDGEEHLAGWRRAAVELCETPDRRAVFGG